MPIIIVTGNNAINYSSNLYLDLDKNIKRKIQKPKKARK
jgi:hypothetical protein